MSGKWPKRYVWLCSSKSGGKNDPICQRTTLSPEPQSRVCGLCGLKSQAHFPGMWSQHRYTEVIAVHSVSCSVCSCNKSIDLCFILHGCRCFSRVNLTWSKWAFYFFSNHNFTFLICQVPDTVFLEQHISSCFKKNKLLNNTSSAPPPPAPSPQLVFLKLELSPESVSSNKHSNKLLSP